MQNPENLYDNRLAALYKVNWTSEQIKIGTNLGSACYHSPEDLCLSIYLKTLRLNIKIIILRAFIEVQNFLTHIKTRISLMVFDSVVLG